jgi:hypothetical protein
MYPPLIRKGLPYVVPLFWQLTGFCHKLSQQEDIHAPR